MCEDDNKLQLVVKDGKIFHVPNNSGDTGGITSIQRWEQALRVFSDIYSSAHPTRASELIQYDHIIHCAAQTYIWENVYMYDKDFRLHMGDYPSRTWAVILQQAWSLRLKDKHKISYEIQRMGNVDRLRSGTRKICRRFNRGKCTYGMRCKYDHRCSFCFKMGHSIHNCRRASAEKIMKVGSPKKDQTWNSSYSPDTKKPMGPSTQGKQKPSSEALKKFGK